MYYISKEFHFSASHQLKLLPADHPCARLHGHNYIVILSLKSPVLNSYGFIRDYKDLDFFKSYINQNFDHKHLNEVFSYEAVTAEFLAKHFFYWAKPHLPELYSVKVSETPKSWAEFRSDEKTS